MTVLSLAAAAEVNASAVLFDEALRNPKSCAGACFVAKHGTEDTPMNFREQLVYTNNLRTCASGSQSFYTINNPLFTMPRSECQLPNLPASALLV